MKRSQTIALTLLAILLSACSFSLAGDVTPPPGYEQQQPQFVDTTPEPPEGPLYPLNPPDLQNGEAIYAEKCIQCHGPAGLGDGEQAAQLPNPVAAIGDAEVARQASPSRWYSIITQGNLDRFMPGFASLSDAERWDVTAYAFSLSTSSEALDTAAELYAANCAECHGDSGQGDGPEAANLSAPLPDFSNPESQAQKSAEEFYTAITEGAPPDMPAFGDSLSEEERWALADYLRNLTFSFPGTVVEGGAPAVTPTTEGDLLPTEIAATQEVTTTVATTSTVGSVTGQVINASGGEIPSDLVLKLHGFDDVQAVITATTDIQPDGSFTFEEVELTPGRSFVVVADMGGTSYASDIATAQAGGGNLELPVTVYETTRDTSQLSIDRMHMIFDFVDDQTLGVIEVYIISNPGNKTVVGESKGEPVLEFKLPEGASRPQFQDGVLGGRYVETENGFADTLPIRPGSGHYQVLFAYDLPYDRKLDLARPVSLPANGVVILVPENGLKIRSDQLIDGGTVNIQNGLYHQYTASGLQAGEELLLTISGRPAGSQAGLALGSSSSLVIGLAGLGLALVVAGLVLYRRSQSADLEEGVESPPLNEEELGPETPDSLMDAILALDDLYAAGQLPEEAYLQRRGELKARLRELMNK